jgi:nitrite reductase/ring-hydroxylating ferredoxin subunit/uncharacterized membrane protein
MAHLFERLMAAQDRWARPFGDFNHRWLAALFGPLAPIKDFLNGRWLGHPIHGVLTDVPIGMFTIAIVLDVLNQRIAADVTILFGVLAMLAAAVAGLADYTDTDGKARTRATLHGTLMVVALLVYVVSLFIRAGGPTDRAIPILVAIIGYLVLAVAAFVGGDVVYVLGNMVNRHAWRGTGTKWISLEVPAETVEADGSLAEGRPIKAKLGINNLVLVRQGDTIHALHEQCAHAGGPLAQGTIVDGCIQCPWHGSRFDLATGAARRGPTVYDQPSYEVRRTDGGWEARRRP